MPVRSAVIGLAFDINKKTRIKQKEKEKAERKSFCFHWRRHPDSDRGVADLQSAALPLGYGAI